MATSARVGISWRRRLSACSHEGLPDLDTGDLRRYGGVELARLPPCAGLDPSLINLAMPLAGKAGIAAQQDAYPRPTLADLRHNPRNLLNRAGRGINVRPA